MFAVAYQLQDLAHRCPGVSTPCTTTCHNVFTHIQQWLIHTPEFQLTIVLISSPVALLVALWGMTGKLSLFLTRSQPHTVGESQALKSPSRVVGGTLGAAGDS